MSYNITYSAHQNSSSSSLDLKSNSYALAPRATTTLGACLDRRPAKSRLNGRSSNTKWPFLGAVNRPTDHKNVGQRCWYCSTCIVEERERAGRIDQLYYGGYLLATAGEPGEDGRSEWTNDKLGLWIGTQRNVAALAGPENQHCSYKVRCRQFTGKII